MNKKISLALIACLLLIPAVLAEPTTADITEPLTKIYDLLKAAVSVVGIIALTFAGAKFMFSGDNMQAREAAKNMATYAVIGLVVIWVAPLVVSYLTAPPAP